MIRPLRFGLLGLLLAASACATSAPTPAATAPSATLAGLKAEAAALRPLVRTGLARAFLDATADLPSVGPRRLLHDAGKTHWYTEAEAARLPADARAALVPEEVSEAFYWYTRYGTPLAYARPLDLLGLGADDLAGRRVLDFGYGGIGQLRLLASLGADVTGVEVDPLTRALYAGDQGAIRGRRGHDGALRLLSGRFPAEAAVRDAAGGGYDLFVSKNVLKRGYIHPEQPVPERQRIRLGVDDETFVRTLFGMLAPGGHVLIYNLTPAPNAPGKPYVPWADGRCPFSRDLLEAAGFRVLAYDRDDTEAARAMGHALGWDRGEDAMDLEHDLFGRYTLLEKPRAP